MRTLLRSLLAEPPAPDPPPRRLRDYLLVALVVLAAVLEVVFESDNDWRPVLLIAGVAIAPTVLIRRARPLPALVIGFGIQAVVDLASVIGDKETELLASTGIAGLFLAYALGRWASGEHVAYGLAAIITTQVLTEANVDDPSIANYFVSLPFLLLPAAVGVVMRYRDNARRQGIADAKAIERQLLARELHDTVAHHVSAIAIQAQAGQTLAAKNPEAAVDILGVIEEAASRTLTDMRRMVRALRDSEPAALAPQAGLAEIERMVATVTTGPRVELGMTGDLEDLAPSVEAGLYRLAQESITNARRHARHATRILVSISASEEEVRLVVSDDGDPAPSDGAGGFGVVGMAERASLLGGTLTAGPAPERGWVVSAVLPRVAGSAP